jgi:hypothetical protein
MVKKKTTQNKTTRFSTWNDFKSAALLVSLGLNVAIITGWVLVKITTDYDAQVYSFLFGN